MLNTTSVWLRGAGPLCCSTNTTGFFLQSRLTSWLTSCLHLSPRFLQDRESSAFRFYRAKVYELCPSINFSSAQESAGSSQSTEQVESNRGEEAEEAELEGEISQAERKGEGGKEGCVPAEEEEERAEKAEEPGTAAEGQAGSSTQSPGSQTAPRAPPQRKRVSSKSLKVGMIPARKRVCHVKEPQGKRGRLATAAAAASLQGLRLC